MECITAVTDTGYTSEFEPTEYIPYPNLTGELWGVFRKDFEENCPHYKSTTLYILGSLLSKIRRLGFFRLLCELW